MKKSSTVFLSEAAMLIAVGTVLSLFKIDMPMGGGLTICSMLPLVIISHRYGWKKGVMCAFVYSMLQLVLGLDNVQYATNMIMAIEIIMLDYIIAYTVIGLSSVFNSFVENKRKSLILGICFTFFLRFLCHFITGVIIWDALWPNEFGLTSVVYSFGYNGWFMGAEAIITSVAALALSTHLEKYIWVKNE
ncbi:MAG: energy-coupled thiamine transporter ThiT [Ruminococcaceae bacterium]|nr:energy-coupled thiamine transporter ThiT [Oscillospiraceae bacterium]